MIALSQITQVIQDGLNAFSSREFVIFNDVGEFKKSYRQDGSNNITRYVNGIMEGLAPTIVPMKNLQVVTQSFRVTFALDIDAMDKDANGNYIEVENIRNILTGYISSVNAQPYTLSETEEDGVSFEVTPTFSGVTVGTATQMSPIGNALPMYLDFSCIFIQSGANTNTVDFIINGENMLFSEYSATRTRTAETNMVANEPSQKTYAQANGLSLNLKMPLLSTTQSKLFEADVWGGTQNKAICVERHRAGANTQYYAYIMTHGNNAENGNVGQNVGQVIDLVEGKEDLLSYGTGWNVLSFTANSSNDKQVNIGDYHLSGLQGKKVAVIWWGDGTYARYTGNAGFIDNITKTYAHNGKYTIRMFSY